MDIINRIEMRERMQIFIVIAAVVLLLCLTGWYCYVLTGRVASLFPGIREKWIAKRKRLVTTLHVMLAAVLAFMCVNIFSVAGIILLHVIAISALFEIIALIVRKIKRDREWKTWEILYKSLAIPVLVSIVLFAYGYANIRDVRRTEYTVATDKELSQDYTILFISDSHYGTIFQREMLYNLAEEMAGEEPDLVLLGGDIVDERTTKDQMEEVFHVFGGLPSKYGVYYVYGNHDVQKYTSNKMYTKEELETAIDESGITILQDDVCHVTEDLVLVGRDDAGMGIDKRKSVSSLLEGVNRTDYIVMMDHQPVAFEENIDAGVDMIMSGHTHAGQIFPLGIFIKYLKTADLWYGHENRKGMDAITSSGIAGWGYPIRTQQHSEYVVVKIN